MKFIPQSQLDKTAWNAFVSKNTSNVFSQSWYLDACATDWCVLIDDEWKNGIALPFASNLGIENTAPFIFGRTIDFIGNDKTFQREAVKKIQERFKVGKLQIAEKLDLNIIEEDALLASDGYRSDGYRSDGYRNEMKVHQIIESKIKLGSQAKRMLKKAEKSGLTIQETTDWKGIIAIAEQELSDKISEFNEANLNRLRNLAKSLSDIDQLVCMGIFEGEKLTGGMLFIITPTFNLYLKGSALPEAKKNGGMYLCMHAFIQKTLAENKIFDFGGSSVEGVQRFNYNFGGQDKSYYIYEWNRAPWWYDFSKKMYHLIKKK